MDENKIFSEIEKTKADADTAHRVTEKILSEYSVDLDRAIRELEDILDSIDITHIDNVSADVLEYYCLKLPALMYRAGVCLEELGLVLDMSSARRKQAFNDTFLGLKTGSVQNRKVYAEIANEEKQLVETIYKRTYTSLRLKIDMADKIYSGIKKALTKRIAENDLNRRDRS